MAKSQQLTTIAHISDVHFGKIDHPDIVDALVDEVNATGYDLVALSGDLTQRARHSEYQAARAMAVRFVPPVLAVPGNHDVYPWWRPFERWFAPTRRWRRYMGDDLTPTFEVPGLAVLGINSAHGRTIKNGIVRDEEEAAIRDFFADRDDSVNVLVLHHHLLELAALGKHDITRHARRVLDAVAELGVDLILCGHLHRSHAEAIEMHTHGHTLVVSSAGTATSNRGRADFRQTNIYNRITCTRDTITVEERKFDLETRRFDVFRTQTFTLEHGRVVG